MTFGDEQLKHCKLEGDWGGSNADMALRAQSTGRCFVQRASAILMAMPSAQREEAIGGAATSDSGDAWYRHWQLFAARTTELMLRMTFTSGSFHTGGTVLLTTRPACDSGVAQEVLYWLHSVTEGDVGAFVKRVTDLAPRGKAIAPSLIELETRAVRYLGEAADTNIPEYYPTQMCPLYGGDWRRVIYDVRQVQQMVPVLGRRICRSSATLAARLGGAQTCLDAVGNYLYAQVGETWGNAAESEPEESNHAEQPPGIDAAYYPFASAIYESCEVDARGQRTGHKDSLRCLKGVLSQPWRSFRDDAAVSRAVVGSVGKFLVAQCALEVAPGLGLDAPMARPFVSADECLAVGTVRARYFLNSWIFKETEGLRNHLRARAAWGARVRQRLPLLAARHQAALRAPPPNDDTWSSASPAQHQKALESIKSTVERAQLLASQLCGSPSPLASALGTRCSEELTGYWLSYAYVPGMRWEGEPDVAQPTAAHGGSD